MKPILILAVIVVASCTISGFIQEPLVEKARQVCDIEIISEVRSDSIAFTCINGEHHELYSLNTLQERTRRE